MLKFVALLMLCCGIIDVGANFDKMTPEQQQIVKQLRASCIAETGVPESVIDDANKGKFDPSTNVQRYTKCVWVTLGIIDDDNVFDGEALLALMPEHMANHAKKSIDKCKITATTDDGILEDVYNYLVCSYQISPAEFYLP